MSAVVLAGAAIAGVLLLRWSAPATTTGWRLLDPRRPEPFVAPLLGLILVCLVAFVWNQALGLHLGTAGWLVACGLPVAIGGAAAATSGQVPPAPRRVLPPWNALEAACLAALALCTWRHRRLLPPRR